MKVLYAIQGTGNGHVSRALEIVPLLQRHCQVDVLLSGTQSDLQLPFPVRYRLRGMSFVFGRKGGVDLWATFRSLLGGRMRQEVATLPVQDYDLVINDFEPVSAWAAFLRQVPCVSLSHQCSLLEQGVPRSRKSDLLGRLVLENYAPSIAHYGFHFKAYAPYVSTPVIRSEVRALQPTDQGHYLVYLPAYDDRKLLRRLQQLPDVRWEVFSKHCRRPYAAGNVWVRPVDNRAFLERMGSCTGVLCGAGFETPAEALFLGKKLLVVPMKQQYEQQCNAQALLEMGVPVLPSLKKKHLHALQEWVHSPQRVQVDYPDCTEQVLQGILRDYSAYSQQSEPDRGWDWEAIQFA